MNANFQRGVMLYEQGRHEMAETEFRQSLMSDPGDALSHSMLGLCLAQSKAYKEATEEAEQGIHLMPDLPYAHFALANVYHLRDRDSEALIAVNEAIRLDPENSDYHALKSGIHLERRDWPAALEAAEQGLQFDAENLGCTNLRAMALVKLGRKSEAGITIDEALAREPENALTQANQGWTCLEHNQPEKAMEHFREALRLEPEMEWARQGIVEALKARYFIYGFMLRYFLWMSRLSRGAQWGVILGAYFGNRMLASAANNNPELAPWLLPFRILIITAFVLTWTADPLFNLILRLNRFGRLALSNEQKVASTWFGLTVVGAVGSLVLCPVFSWNPVFLHSAMVFGFLLIPVSGMFKASKGWPRNVLMIWTAVLALAGLSSCVLGGWSAWQGLEPGNSLDRLSSTVFIFFLFGTVAFMWGANVIMAKKVRH